MIQNRRAYQLIHCHTRSRLLAGAAAVCGAACGHADLGLYHLLHRGGAPLPDSTQADRAALAALCPKPAAEETCPLLPQQDPAVTLSVIVPVYNGEATIGPCLDRYRALPGVLLCNCSAPRSAAAARNEGLRHAVGRWLMFVDSDDLLLPGAIRTLLEAAQRLDADVVQGGWQYLYTDGTRGPVQRYPAAVYTGAAAPERFELPGMPWGKVYRRELFAQVRFPAYYTCFEDAIIHFLVFRLAKTVASVPEMVYLWRKNPKGLTATSQHRPAAVQSYWIMEQLAVQDAALGLPHDALYRCTLTLQLSALPLYPACRRKRSRLFSGCAVLCTQRRCRKRAHCPAVPAGVPGRCGSRTLGCGAATAEDFSCYNVRSAHDTSAAFGQQYGPRRDRDHADELLPAYRPRKGPV